MLILFTATFYPVSVYVVTWNLQGEQPKCDLSQLLAIKSTTDGLNSSPPTPDMYVIGLQETCLWSPSVSFTNPWIEAFDNVLRPLDYVRVKSVRMVETLIMVYVKRQCLPRLRDIEV